MSNYNRIATETIRTGDYVSPTSRKYMWSRVRRYRANRGYAPMGYVCIATDEIVQDGDYD